MKKFVSIAMTLAILVSACMLPLQVSAESIEDTAQSITSGKTVSGYLESYEGGDWANIYDDYSINVSGNGKLSINASGDFSSFIVNVYDENGNLVVPIDINATTGNAYNSYGSFSASWNDITKKFNATATYNVKKATYYIRLYCGSSASSGGGGNFKMTVTDSSAKASNTASSSSSNSNATTAAVLTVAVKKGATLQLGAALPSSNTAKPTWKTSSSKVATVSSSGKVTAVAKGTATITATAGKTVLKIKVVVS